MGKLIGLIRPLVFFMVIAVMMGTAGYLCASFLTIAGAAGALMALGQPLPAIFPHTFRGIFLLLVCLGVLRGVLHYFEQECNHYIAFKLLAIIRHQVFAALRRLCPAKLEGKDRGNLISLITSDIELLEVFYAHTVSPIAIAFLTSLIMVCWIGSFHPLCGVLALAGYSTVGILLPLWNGKRGAAAGMAYRQQFGRMNSFILDSLRGLQEILQYGRQKERLEELKRESGTLAKENAQLKRHEGDSAAACGACISLFSFAMLFLSCGCIPAAA